MKIGDKMSLIITSLLTFASISGIVAQDTTISINVMSYNIKNAWGGTTLEPIADVIVEQKLDYLALQEVDSVNSRSSYKEEAADETAILAQLTEMHYEFARGISFLGGAYGNAMLSKLPFSNTIKILLPGAEARVALLTDIDLSEGSDPGNATITFICTHWMNGDAQAQLESAQIINEYIDELIEDNSNSVDEKWPFLLLGDLNAVNGSSPIEEMRAHWETGNFNYGIDWLFFRPAERWNWISSSKLSDPNKKLSDHDAVVSEIELLSKAGE